MSDHGYWISPDGKIYDVEGGGYASHNDFAARYFFDVHSDAEYVDKFGHSDLRDEIIDMGWVRIRLYNYANTMEVDAKKITPIQNKLLKEIAKLHKLKVFNGRTK